MGVITFCVLHKNRGYGLPCVKCELSLSIIMASEGEHKDYIKMLLETRKANNHLLQAVSEDTSISMRWGQAHRNWTLKDWKNTV